MVTTPHYLKWVGGKRRLAKTIQKHFGGHCYKDHIEPFVGSGAVFLERMAAGEIEHAHLADINAGLICTHVAVRSATDQVLTALTELPTEDGEWQEVYYEKRTTFNEMKAEAEQTEWSLRWQDVHGPDFAALFLWINRACFNGMYRENKKGVFNIPIGRYKNLSLPSKERLYAASDLLARTNIVSGDFERSFHGIREGDHVYCDPPYVPTSETSNFVNYSKSGFTWRDHCRLAGLGAMAAAKGATVILSNSDVPEVRELYTGLGYVLHIVETNRSVGAAASTRRKVTEIIAVHSPLGG